MDKGDKGSDSEGFSFGGLLKYAKKARQKMVRLLYVLSKEASLILVDTGPIFQRITNQ